MRQGPTIAVLLPLVAALPAAVRAARGTPPKAGAQAAASVPDLSGVWDTRAAAPARTSSVSSRLPTTPMTPWAEELFKPIKSSYAGPDGYLNDPLFKCFPPGVPRTLKALCRWFGFPMR